jgi:hypothetical protein
MAGGSYAFADSALAAERPEEVESITTAEPVLAAYLDLQRQMLRHNHNLLSQRPPGT